jgi:CheY-like chemotaxis protein
MSKKRVLLVDDEAGFTRLLRLVLKDFEIFEENDPTKALDAARRIKPDIIFLDVIMPELDGGSLAAEMRADPILGQTPIVFLTAIVSPVEAKDKSVIGGFPFLAKPVTKDKLVQCINKFLPPTLS